MPRIGNFTSANPSNNDSSVIGNSYNLNYSGSIKKIRFNFGQLNTLNGLHNSQSLRRTNGSISCKINKKSNLNSTVYYQFGKSGATAINWYDANDPRPDYYKYLPSYYEDTEPEVAAQLAEEWATDDTRSQLDWDHFYFANGKNLFSQENVGGVSGVLVGFAVEI